MTIMDNMITLFQAIVLLYLFVVLFRVNHKYNKMLMIGFIFIATYLLLFKFENNIITYLVIILAFTEVYVVYEGNFINNLIKVSLVGTCFRLFITAFIVIISQIYKLIAGIDEIIYLYGEDVEQFSYVARILSTLAALVLILIVDKQFGEWVFNIKGLTQAILFTLLYLIPLVFMMVSDFMAIESSAVYLTLRFIVNVLLQGAAVFIAVILGIIDRKKEYIRIRAKVDKINEEYIGLLYLQNKLAVLRHDLNHFLEVDAPEYEKFILDYCDSIERDMEAMNE